MRREIKELVNRVRSQDGGRRVGMQNVKLPRSRALRWLLYPTPFAHLFRLLALLQKSAALLDTGQWRESRIQVGKVSTETESEHSW